jgi:hypothetical protein
VEHSQQLIARQLTHILLLCLAIYGCFFMILGPQKATQLVLSLVKRLVHGMIKLLIWCVKMLIKALGNMRVRK